MSKRVSTKTTVKDVNRPKKASTAYILFSNDMREQVKTSNPNMKSNEIMTELGRLWKLLPESEKAKYSARFEAEKERYQNEMSSYVPPTPVVESKKTLNTIKKPMNAYVHFCQEQRSILLSEKPEMRFGELTKELADRWKLMNDTQKAPYVRRSQEQKDKYLKTVSQQSAPVKSTTPAVTTPAVTTKKTGGSRKKVVVDEERLDEE